MGYLPFPQQRSPITIVVGDSVALYFLGCCHRVEKIICYSVWLVCMVFSGGQPCCDEKGKNHGKHHRTFSSFLIQGLVPNSSIHLVNSRRSLFYLNPLFSIPSQYTLSPLSCYLVICRPSCLATVPTATDISLLDSTEETRWCGLVILSCLVLSVLEQTA